MPIGTPITRDLVFVLRSGEVVLDWGDGRVQDILTGDFLTFEERDYAHAVMDDDLDNLKKSGRVFSYDHRYVYLGPLPEPPRKTIE
jgi:hypothetical protein